MKKSLIPLSFIVLCLLQFQAFAQPGNVVYGNNNNMPGGIANTGVGEGLGTTNTSSVENSLFGYKAGTSLTSASGNSSFGAYAGRSLTTGDHNFFAGYQSGNFLTSGSGNIFMGYRSGYNNNGSKNIFLGYQAGYNETGSNLLYIDNSSTSTPLIWGDFSSNRIGINYNDPDYTLHVGGTFGTTNSITANGDITSSNGSLISGNHLFLGDNGYIDDDNSAGGSSDDWIRLRGYLEVKSNTDSYGIVLRDKDDSNYLGITQRDGTSRFSDSSNSDNFFLKGDGRNTYLGDHLYGKSVNGQYSNLYRFGGIHFTWDSDTYGTNTSHSIRSTYGDTYGDDLTINSYNRLRINIDANNNDSNESFEIGKNTTGTANTMFTVREDGHVGIGTDTPQEALHVMGNVRGNQTGGALRIQTEHGLVDIGPKNTGWMHFYTDRSKFYFEKEIHVKSGIFSSYQSDLTLQTDGTTALTILDANQNVGIGTTDILAKLDVRSSGTIGAAYNESQAFFRVGDGTINMIMDGNEIYGSEHLNIGAKNEIIFRNVDNVGSEELMRIKSNGRVGIGTSTPAHELDVAGDIGASGTLFDSEGNSSEWNTAYDWGNHNDAGYYKNGSNVSFGTLSTTGTMTIGNGNADFLDLPHDDLLVRFDKGQKMITSNDGSGNFSIQLGQDENGNHIGDGGNDDGSARILIEGDGQNGTISLNAGTVMADGNPNLFNIGINVTSSDQTLRIGNPDDNKGLRQNNGRIIAKVDGTLVTHDLYARNDDLTISTTQGVAMTVHSDNDVEIHQNLNVSSDINTTDLTASGIITANGGASVNGTLDLNDKLIHNLRGIRMQDWDDNTGGTDDKYRILARDGAFQFYNGGVVVGNYANGTWPDLADGRLIVEKGLAVNRTSIESGYQADIEGNVRVRGSLLPNSLKGTAAGGSLKVQTNHGYVEIGPRNTTWSHFITDRPRFYFNQSLTVNGGKIGSYTNQNLQLQTDGITAVTIDHNDQKVTAHGDMEVEGHVTLDTGKVFRNDSEEWLVALSEDGTLKKRNVTSIESPWLLELVGGDTVNIMCDSTLFPSNIIVDVIDLNGNLRIGNEAFIDNDLNPGGLNDDWMKFNQRLEFRSSHANEGIVLFDKDSNTEYLNVFHDGGTTQFSNGSGAYFLQSTGRSVTFGGDVSIPNLELNVLESSDNVVINFDKDEAGEGDHFMIRSGGASFQNLFSVSGDGNTNVLAGDFTINSGHAFLSSTPTEGAALSQVLVRDPSGGQLKYRNAASLSPWTNNDTYVQYDGQVGINVSGAPTADLEVNGTFKTNSANINGTVSAGWLSLQNKEHYTGNDGDLYFDLNVYADDNGFSHHFTGGNGGAIAYKGQEGWGALIATNNMEFITAKFDGLNVTKDIVTDSHGTSDDWNTAYNERGSQIAGNGLLWDGTNSVLDFDSSVLPWQDVAGVLTHTGTVAVDGTFESHSATVDNYLIHNGDEDTKIGFSTNDVITMFTANENRLTINNIGRVGIGTTTPSRQLTVDGFIRAIYDDTEDDFLEIGHGGGNAFINMNGAGDLDFRFDGDNLITVRRSGHLDLRTHNLYNVNDADFASVDTDALSFATMPVGGTTADEVLVVAADGSVKSIASSELGEDSPWVENNGNLSYNSGIVSTKGLISNVANANDLMFLGQHNGTESFRLYGNGIVEAKEVVVSLEIWPDYVFEADYDLRPLEEVEQFVKENNHLPDVPSEEEVSDEGVKVGEMEAILLQKVEELTLYLIDQNKQLKEQSALIQEQAKLIKELQEKVD